MFLTLLILYSDLLLRFLNNTNIKQKMMVISALCFEANVDPSLEYLFGIFIQWIPQICLSFYLKYLEDISGGSRISSRWRRHSSMGVPTDDFAKLSTELDEIERIWTPRGIAC